MNKKFVIKLLSKLTKQDNVTCAITLDRTQSIDRTIKELLELRVRDYKKIKKNSIVTISHPVFSPNFADNLICKVLEVYDNNKSKKIIIEDSDGLKPFELGTNVGPILLLEDLREFSTLPYKYNNKHFIYETLLSVRPANKYEKKVYKYKLKRYRGY